MLKWFINLFRATPKQEINSDPATGNIPGNKSAKDFTQTMLETLLPAVERMIQKEEDFIRWMEARNKKGDYNQDIIASQKSLNHLKMRQKEYEEGTIKNW